VLYCVEELDRAVERADCVWGVKDSEIELLRPPICLHGSSRGVFFLSVCLFVCPSLYLSVCLQSFCLSVCLSGYFSICPSICLSVRLSIYLCTYLSLCLYAYLFVCLSVCLFICQYVSVFCLPVSLSIYLFVSLSISLSVWLSISLSTSLFVCLPVCLWVCLSVYLSTCLPVCLCVCQLAFHLKITPSKSKQTTHSRHTASCYLIYLETVALSDLANFTTVTSWPRSCITCRLLLMRPSSFKLSELNHGFIIHPYLSHSEFTQFSINRQ
jgi:hypothetical protein